MTTEHFLMNTLLSFAVFCCGVSYGYYLGRK